MPTHKLTVDADRYDELQPWFVGQLIESTKRHLEEAGLSGEQLKDLCGSIVFSACTLIDNSAGFEVEGKDYSPHLAFEVEEGSLIYPGGNSYLHEYVFGVLDELFQGTSDA